METQELKSLKAPTKEELLIDIYFYKRGYETAIDDTEKKYFNEKFYEAEELFKNINND